jgi:hypothetical protein
MRAREERRGLRCLESDLKGWSGVGVVARVLELYARNTAVRCGWSFGDVLW